jgi:hypothetical protein
MKDEIKFGVLIPKDLNDSLNSMIPWGLKSRLFIIMLQRLNHELKLGGNRALAEWLNWKPSDK